MNIEKFKLQLEEQFISDYEKLNSFRININDILDELKIDNKYETYNTFCLEIEKNAMQLFKQNSNIIITPKLLTNILNDMIKIKIIDDSAYEKKLKKLFSNNILDEIKKFKN